MKQYLITLLWLGLLVAFSARAAQPVTATLELVPDNTLPGTPVAFLINFANAGDAPQTVVNGVSLDVTSASGTFAANAIDRRRTASLPTDQMTMCHSVSCLVIPAHGHGQLYIDVDATASGNEFFADPRLSVPGTYYLQLTLATFDQTQAVTWITTNSAKLTIPQPAGVDAEAWQFLRNVAGGRSWTVTEWTMDADGAAPEVLAKYPTSAYMPWFAVRGAGASFDSRLARIDAALALAPAASLRDDLLLAKARLLARASDHALLADRNADLCLSYADAARTAYTNLQQQAISQAMKARAAEGLTHIYSRKGAEDGLRMFANDDAPSPAKIVPRVECVTPGIGNAFSARFGYTNPNTTVKVLQIGDLNQVTPAPRDQGQPRSFSVGQQTAVFTATSSGGQLIWHLDGSKAVASANFPVKCTAVTP
jgi:hypothetical protein